MAQLLCCLCTYRVEGGDRIVDSNIIALLYIVIGCITGIVMMITSENGCGQGEEFIAAKPAW